MRIVVTLHAATKLRAHALPLELVERGVNEPDWTEPDPLDPALTRYYVMTPQRDYRIVGRFEDDDFVLVSVFPDRGARRRRERLEA